MPRTRKQFGQHWLKSDKALRQIVDAAELSADRDRVLEIGPGTGILTRQLLQQARLVVAVEIDRDLCQLLRNMFQSADTFLLIEGDFLSLDLKANLANFPKFSAPDSTPNKVVANIPYNITGPILEKLLGTISHPPTECWESLVLLVQKEVAERLCAKPGSRAFGALSVRVQYLAECEWISTVPAGAFQPPPKVDSAVVRLRPRRFAPPAHHPKYLEQLVKLGFAAKRKMLRNNLKSIVDRDRLTSFLENRDLAPEVRAEDLGVADWVALSNWLSEQNDERQK